MTNRLELVINALQEVSELRKVDFRGDDNQVCALLRAYPDDEAIADLLWNELPENASAQDIADLLSLWSWRNNDNGGGIMRAMERWISDCSDPKRILVALNLDA